MVAGLATTGVIALGAAAGGEDAIASVSRQGIKMSTDPNMYKLPSAIAGVAESLDTAFGNRPSTYGKAAGRALSDAGSYYSNRSEESPREVNVAMNKAREAWDGVREMDRKMMDYGNHTT